MSQEMHPFWQIAHKPQHEQRQSERCVIAAVFNLSVSLFSHLTFEQIFDLLNEFTERSSVMRQLNRIEETINHMSTKTDRLQASADALSKQADDTQTILNNAAKAILDGNARLEADIAALRNQQGGGDPAVLDTIADSLDATKAKFATLADQLKSIQVAEDAEDVPPPVALVITPSSATVDRTSTQQFTANKPGAWSTDNGSIGADGLYVPPTDATVTSATVTLTPTDGSGPGTASVSITDASQPSPSATQGMKQ